MVGTTGPAGRADRDQQSGRTGDRAQAAGGGGAGRTAPGGGGKPGGPVVSRGTYAGVGMGGGGPGSPTTIGGGGGGGISGRPTEGGGALAGVDPATIQKQQGRVVLDPITGNPIGTMPEGQLTIGGPARAYPENSDTNTAQALAAHGLAPAGSTELGNAINSQHYYTDAMKKQNEPGFGGWARRNLSLMGLEQAPVRLDQPATYAEGSPQLGLNPPGLIGGLAGGALGFPGLGPAAGAAFTAAGGRDLVLSGGQAFDPQTGQPAAPPAARSLPPGFRASGAAGGQVPSSTPSATVPSGASQPVQQTPAASSGTPQQAAGPAPAYGQKSGGTIITGSNTVAWPWSQVNA